MYCLRASSSGHVQSLLIVVFLFFKRFDGVEVLMLATES